MFQNINQNVVSSISDFNNEHSKSCKKTFLDNCSSSKLLICDDNLNSSNSEEMNRSITLPILADTNDTSNNALMETNVISNNSNEMNQADCEYIIQMLSKNNLDSADVNTQDQNKIDEVLKKYMSCIFPENGEEIEINTQQLMDICLQRVTKKLEQFKTNVDVINKQITELVALDGTIPNTNELQNSEQNNRNISVNEPLACNNAISITPLEFFEYPNQDHDPEVIVFKAMCEEMLNIRAIGNNGIHINPPRTVNNQVEPLIFKQLNEDVLCCVNEVECVSSTSKLNPGVNSKLLRNNDILYSNCPQKIIDTLDSSDESSYENKYESYPTKYKRPIKMPKMTSSPKSSNTKSNPLLNKMQYQYNNVLKNILISSSEEEIDGELNESKMSEKQNCHRKRNNVHLPEKNKRLKKNEPMFRCSPNGLIHKDMLKFINLKKK